MQIEQRESEGIAILELRGRLVMGEATSLLQDTMDALVADSKTSVILDLQHVPAIDSSGLGMLVFAHTQLEKAGGALRLLHLQQRHMELLVLTKLNAFFQIFDEEGAAIDSFFPGRKPRTFDILEFVKSNEDSDNKPFSATPEDEEKRPS